MSKIKVSVIDDLEEVKQGFSFLINSSDELECIGSYSNAEDALAEINIKTPDVIVMDIGLPGMSGIECTRQIKSTNPEIQIMIFTIYEDDERLFKALAAGASGYVLKSSPPNMLIESVKDIYKGGSPMSSQIARKVVASLQERQNLVNPNAHFNISDRENEILNLLSDGYRNKEIAEKLFISIHTVKSHIYHIYDKLHVQSRVEALNKISSGK